MMFDEGLENEIQFLKQKGYSKETPGMKAIGYKEFFESDDIEEIKHSIKRNTIRYAKKQYTYINNIPQSNVIEWHCSQELDYKKLEEIILKKCEEWNYKRILP